MIIKKIMGKIIGIDISLEMIKHASVQSSLVLQCDSHFLPFRYKTFHSVFAFAVLPNLKHLDKFCQEISSVLVFKGYFIV